MAHKKGVGSSRNGRESHSKRLGVKIFGGSYATAGNIIVRQRGTQHNPGVNVGMGKDHTLYALCDGTVIFRKRTGNKSYVSIEPIAKEVVVEEKPDVDPVNEAPKDEIPAEVTAEDIKTPEAEAEPEMLTESSSSDAKESSE